MGISCAPQPKNRTWNLAPIDPGNPFPNLAPGPHPQQVDALIALAEKRSEGNSSNDSLIWRRLAQIQLKRGKRAEARAYLIKAARCADEAIVRSLVADELAKLGETKVALEALGTEGYLGFRPELMPGRRNALPSATEKPRLLAPSLTGRGLGSSLQVFPTRLVIQLVVRGAQKEVETLMHDRLTFALGRGPYGGREQAFHDAILCSFYLGHYAEALKATERETPLWQVQTLGCLLAGGATDPESVLFPDTRLPERDADPRVLQDVPMGVQQDVANRLKESLRRVPIRTGEPTIQVTERLEETYLARIVMLAALLGHWDVAQVGAERIADPVYRAQFARSLAAKMPPVFTPIHPTQTLGAVGTLSQNLSRIGRLNDAQQGRRLLNQLVAEAKAHQCLHLVADAVSQAVWMHEAPELVPELISGFPMVWFQIAQTLKLAELARKQQDTATAQRHLRTALGLLGKLTKPNQRILLSLDVAEEARLQGDTSNCDRLRNEMQAFLPTIGTSTVRTEAALRLLRLHCFRHDQSAYKAGWQSTLALIVEAGQTFPAEEDRLRIELSHMLVEAGDFPAAYTVLQPVRNTVVQPHALCNLLEAELALTLPPRSYTAKATPPSK